MIVLVTGLMRCKKPFFDLISESKLYSDGRNKLTLSNVTEVSITNEIMKSYNNERDPEFYEDLDSFVEYKLREDPNYFIRNCISFNKNKNLLVTDWKYHNEKYFLLEMGYFPTTVRLFDTAFKENYLSDITTDFLVVQDETQFKECLKRYPTYSLFREYKD